MITNLFFINGLPFPLSVPVRINVKGVTIEIVEMMGVAISDLMAFDNEWTLSERQAMLDLIIAYDDELLKRGLIPELIHEWLQHLFGKRVANYYYSDEHTSRLKRTRHSARMADHSKEM